MQILVIEDDKRISDFLIKGLEENNYLVTLCKNAEYVLEDYLSIEWDLIICDIMLPGMDGIQFVQTLRFKKIYVPVLMLSALGSDKIRFLHQTTGPIWGITFNNQTNVVDVYISYLRNKIELNDEKYIYTVKGVGYMFNI